MLLTNAPLLCRPLLLQSVQTFGRKKNAVAVAYVKRGKGEIRLNGEGLSAHCWGSSTGSEDSSHVVGLWRRPARSMEPSRRCSMAA